MDYRVLGSTGMHVSSLCFGAMMLGEWGNRDHDDSVRIIHTALDAGVNFIDTADVYSDGESEVIVGKALAGSRRDDVVLATKAYLPMGEDTNHRGSSRRWLYQELDNSLRRLGTDHVDLYQLHRPDPHTDLEETLSALTDLQRAGKIRYFGCSTFPAHEIMRSHWVSERRHLSRFLTEQPPYSILARAIEGDVLPVTQQLGMGTLTWAPLAGGWLSGRYRTGDVPQSSRADRMPDRFDLTIAVNQVKLHLVEQLAQLAEQAGVTMIQLALGFATAHPGVTSAIIGPRTHEHLHDYLSAADIRLSGDVLDQIDAIVVPGRTIADADRGYLPPSLLKARLRRRLG
jgi:aryl-alcohol dehydrogenase-like predicted oxidoreductase